MKSLLLAILTTIALCSSSLATDEKTIEAKDAAEYVGQQVVVHGTIADVHQFKGGSIILNFGAKYPNEVFEVYIPKNLVDTLICTGANVADINCGQGLLHGEAESLIVPERQRRGFKPAQATARNERRPGSPMQYDAPSSNGARQCANLH